MKTSLRFSPFSSRLQALAVLVTATLPTVLGACSQTPVTVDLHSLQASGNVSFVCRGDDNSPAGHKLDECPDYEHLTRRTLGLVTQTATNEVAIVDLLAGAVVDVDPTTPGYSFLRVGARPGAIVTTPGGAASFVGVSGLQKNGIFALPTTCLAAPQADTPARDLTTWSACSLSSAPGDIAVVIDPQAADGTSRETCGPVDTAPHLVPQAKRVCPADLTAEQGPKGRRKLLVALPDEHELVLIDAQSLLDRAPGAFEQCNIEHRYHLDAALPTGMVLRPPPPDLTPDTSDPNTCQTAAYPPPASTAPTPAGFALSSDRLYVADRTLPVVHVLDVSDPCVSHELPPLLPYSYLAPNRVVTTSRVAVSPLTPGGKQFVYAVDEDDQPTASVMVFDVSPLSNGERTPLIFPGAPRQPFVPPDRLQFGSPVKDVSFVMRDFPAPDGNGVGQFGLSCDPFPGSNGPGAQYQPNSDFSIGARPLNLRGVFAFVMLKNGQIVVVDVEDFDAPCRRPVTSNASSVEDFRGCASDKPAPNQSAPPEFYTLNGAATDPPTVTNESSCHIIEPHRPRAASLSISNTTVGLRSPTLRSFPQFSNPDPSAIIANDKQPRLLGVDFANPDPNGMPVPAQVNISSQVYCSSLNGPPPCDATAQLLDLEPPHAAQQNSVVLPLSEPRSYALEESAALVFEGRVFPPRSSGFLQLTDAAGQALPPEQAFLQDPDGNFCGAGVEDSDSILNEAESLKILGSSQAAWAKKHADYVEITGDFPAVQDVYWTKNGGGGVQGCTRDRCANEFGNIDNPEVLSVSRDLSILEAHSDHVVITPRCQNPDGTVDTACDPTVVLKDLRCCFPTGTPYTVRASHQWLLGSINGTVFSSGLHDLSTGANGRCVHTASCDPRKKFLRSRAFEVCDENTLPKGASCNDDDNAGCTVSGIDGPVKPGGAANACIFENLTSRFVVYRGEQPSTRGMSFSWQTTGGFSPLSMSLSTQSTQVSPQSMSYLPGYGYLAVVDASTLGLSLFDLNSLGVVPPSPYF